MKKNTLTRLLKYMKPHIKYLVIALGLSLVAVGCTLLGPVFIGQAIDTMIGPEKVVFSRLIKIIAAFITVSLVGFLLQWLVGICTGKASFYAMRDLREEAFGKIVKAPFSYIDNQSHGDLVNRIVNDVDFISDGMIQGFTQLFSGVVMIVGTLGFMLSLNVTIALLVVVLTPISILFALFISKRTFGMAAEQTRIQGEMSGYVSEMISQQKVVQAFSHEEKSEEDFEKINQKLKHWGFRAQLYPAFTNPITRFINGLVYAAVGIGGAFVVLGGTMTIGQLSSFLSYANQYTKPFNEVSGIAAQLQTALSAANRVFELMDTPQEIPDAPGAQVIDHVEGEVAFNHVSFSYTPQKPFIQNLSLTVDKGNRVAIVGTTGSGKTTLINLLMRFYEIDKGEIHLDQYDHQRVTRQSLRSQFGMVLQDTWLKNGTVFENIAYGKPEATLEEVVIAAKKAYAHYFIERLEEGYNTILVDNGGNLSQGQRQLLCIARVMLTSPPILLLDEATSSIDTRTEILVQEAFLHMMEGKTSFVVAHRLSTIIHSDIILVMEGGNIVEKGSHRELLEKNGPYAKLYLSQYQHTQG